MTKQNIVKQALAGLVLLAASVTLHAQQITDDLQQRAAEGSKPPELFVIKHERNVNRSAMRETNQRGWGKALLAEYEVQLNLNILTKPPKSVQARMQQSRNFDENKPIALIGQHLNVRLPLQKGMKKLLLNTAHQNGDVISYAGVIKGDDSSMVTLTVQGDEMLGRIHSAGMTYLLEKNPKQGTTLSLIDPSLMPDYEKFDDRGMKEYVTKKSNHQQPQDMGLEWFEAEPKPNLPSQQQSNHVMAKSGSSNGNVRVLVLYTPKVAQRNNINLLANNIINETNTSLLNSGVPSSNKVTLAGMKKMTSDYLGYRECTNHLVENSMIGRNNGFENILQWRSLYKADAVLLLVTTEPSMQACPHGSLGRIGGFAYRFYSSFPYASVADTWALADLTAIHELGHVMGGGHEDDSDDPGVGELVAPPYARGYAFRPQCGWQTMMGGYKWCKKNQATYQPTTRLPYWSDPTAMYFVFPRGQPERNMVAALNIMMPNAAASQPDPPPPPSIAPSSLTATSHMCWGMTNVSWGASSGATMYKLFYSTYSTYNPQFVAYDGTARNSFVNIGSNSTYYFRVKACNAGGCSGFSNQVSASWVNGCY